MSVKATVTFLSTALLLLMPAANAADAPPALSGKPIIVQDQPPYICKTAGYLEGPSQCGWLQGLGEPVLPVTDEETRLAIRMNWVLGDLNPSITLRVEIQNTDQAFIKVYEGTGAEAKWRWTEGMARLSSAEIGQLIAAERKADIWSKPHNLKSIDKGMPGRCTIETVFLCYDFITLAEVRTGEQKVVDGACADRKVNADVIAFAHLLIRIAQHHFPGVGTTPLWRDELTDRPSRP